jgi:hypothetical protein
MGDGCSHVITLVDMYEDRHNDSIAWLALGHADRFTVYFPLLLLERDACEGPGMVHLRWMETLTRRCPLQHTSRD